DPALALMRRRVAPVLAISGAFLDPKWTKAHRLCRGEEGPTRYRVLCFVPQPYSTRGEARAIARLAVQHGWRRVIVVTSTFHVTRTEPRAAHTTPRSGVTTRPKLSGARRRPRSPACGSPFPRARSEASCPDYQPPVAPLYVPPNNASGVFARIFRSSRGERCS